MPKDEAKVLRGKKSRAQGSAFELRVRKDLDAKGWAVDKWSNNVELSEVNSLDMDGFHINGKFIFGRLVQAKNKWAGPNRPLVLGAGFPDFVAFRPTNILEEQYEVIGVESKMNGKLDKEEKLKCEWLLKKRIFNSILIASKHKIKNRIHIKYQDFATQDYLNVEDLR